MFKLKKKIEGHMDNRLLLIVFYNGYESVDTI